MKNIYFYTCIAILIFVLFLFLIYIIKEVKSQRENVINAVYMSFMLIISELIIVFFLVETFTFDKKTYSVILEKLPSAYTEKNEYFNYEDNVIEYFNGDKMIFVNVSNHEIIFDAKEKPYMLIEEYKNILNKTICSEVVIHLKQN